MSLLQKGRRHDKGSVEPQVKTSPQPPWIPHACESTGKMVVVTLLDGMTDPVFQGEIGGLLHNRGNKKYVWNTRDP